MINSALGVLDDLDAIHSSDDDQSDFPDINPYYYAAHDLWESNEDGDRRACSGLVAVSTIVEAHEKTIGYLLKYHAGTGQQGEFYVTGTELGNKASIDMLKNVGILVYIPSLLHDYLYRCAVLLHCKPTLRLVNSIGWGPYDDYFYTGESLLHAPDLTPDQMHCEVPDFSPLVRQGNLEEWKESIGVHIEANPMPLVFCCIALASLLLHKAGIASGIFNLYGTHGKGKTLCLQLAASIFGNGSDPAFRSRNEKPYMGKFNGTEAGLEAVLRNHSPLPVILDELGETSISSLDRLCYSMASGQGKSRMRSNLKAADRGEWLLNTLVSSERSITDLIQSRGKQQMGGQSDRAADIPFPKDGIFTDFGQFDTFDDLTRHLKSATRQAYGTPCIAFIQYCLDHPSEVDTHLAELPEIAAEMRPAGCESGAFRVVLRFSLAYLAGKVAIEAGILDCDEGDLAEAFEKLISIWWEQRFDCLARLKSFIEVNQIATVHGLPRKDGTTKLFCYKDLVVIPKHIFDAEFGRDFASDLESAGALKREQDDRLTHRFGSGSSTLYGYAIYASHVSSSDAEDEAEADLEEQGFE